MRVSLKVLILVIFVLSLSILAKPQPGECASAVEYGPWQGNGIIASIKNNGAPVFKPYTMNLTINQPYTPVPSAGQVQQYVFTGVMTLTNVANSNTDTYAFTGSMDPNSSKLLITTTTGPALMSGTVQADGSIPLVWQDISKGHTGYFDLIFTPGQ